jgi:hypothetical protein
LTKRIKYISALFLLLIFPISAIGLDISFHKCKHSGTVNFSLYKSEKGKAKESCCCNYESNKTIKEQTKSEIHESVNSEVKKDLKQKGSCCENKSKKAKISSCCTRKVQKQNNNAQTIELTLKNEPENKTKTENNIGVNLKKNPCCSYSNIYFFINQTIINCDISLKSLKSYSELPSKFNNINFNTVFTNKSLLKIVDYPLKEPVNTIISFIHLISNFGDDSDISLNLS